jgi:hypothetical protein
MRGSRDKWFDDDPTGLGLNYEPPRYRPLWETLLAAAVVAAVWAAIILGVIFGALALGASPAQSRVAGCQLDADTDYIAGRLSYAARIHQSWVDRLRTDPRFEPDMVDRPQQIRWHLEWVDVYDRTVKLLGERCVPD